MSHPIWIEEPPPVTAYRSGTSPGYRVTALVRSSAESNVLVADSIRRASFA